MKLTKNEQKYALELMPDSAIKDFDEGMDLNLIWESLWLPAGPHSLRRKSLRDMLLLAKEAKEKK